MQKLVRNGATAAGLVVALSLALTGCGSDSGSGDAGKDTGATAPSGDASGSGAGSGADAASVEGTWAGLTDGKSVALAVSSGKVALVAAEHVCQGAVEDMSGEPMLTLKCGDGNTERTMGSIESNDGKTLVISWTGGTKDTLKKTAADSLPTGLPTDLPTGLPTDLPTDLPTG
ncbi:hypothetical protein ACIQVO_29730 [Streptomyces sp. NPDC101062]|uniref:hypothetical protein n=1 Tax=unclassified Streptomyces TaxID=2593676 RepID=UPI002E769848|nr:hypothetical protein [Streptomyces sp. JV176]MEE1797959.1 hypothetical protein [Streptomyces sp. JV176]